MGREIRSLGQISFRLGDGLLPLVGAHGPHLGQQLVLTDLQSASTSRPVRKEPLRPERRRPQEIAARPNLDEVNFWQPSGATQFRALAPSELFLFKLHAPRQFIVGGALFAYSTILPLSLAWDAFEEKNGAISLDEMRLRIAKYRRTMPDPRTDYEVGVSCSSSRSS